MKDKVVLCVAAHPDDLDFAIGGTIAKWVKQGVFCYYLICTNGSKGSSDPSMTGKKLVEIRRQEQLKASKILGVKDVFFLKHNDAELVADLVLKKEIVYYIRKLQPEIVISMDPTFVYSPLGFINHTDHRAAGQATIDAVFPMARDRLTFPQHERQGLLPYRVKMLYLVSFEKPTEIIDISDFIDLKFKAINVHQSQVSDNVISRIKERAQRLGKKQGYSFAEGFIKINLPS